MIADEYVIIDEKSLEHLLTAGSGPSPATPPLGDTPCRPAPPPASRGSVDSLRGLVCLGVVFMHLNSGRAGVILGGLPGWSLEFAVYYC